MYGIPAIQQNSHSRAFNPETLFYILGTGQVSECASPQGVLQHSIHLRSIAACSTKQHVLPHAPLTVELISMGLPSALQRAA